MIFDQRLNIGYRQSVSETFDKFAIAHTGYYSEKRPLGGLH
jgi:hypothetical protein